MDQAIELGPSDAAARREIAVPLAVTAADLDAALEELLDTRNAMTRVLLGSPAGTPAT